MASPAVLIRAERTCLAKPDTAPRTQVAQQVGCSALRISHARNPHARTTRCPPAALPGSVPRRTKNRRSALHAPERRAAHCRLRTRFGCRLIAHLGTPPGLARPRRKFRHENPMHQGSGPPPRRPGRSAARREEIRKENLMHQNNRQPVHETRDCTKPATARNPRRAAVSPIQATRCPRDRPIRTAPRCVRHRPIARDGIPQKTKRDDHATRPSPQPVAPVAEPSAPI